MTKTGPQVRLLKTLDPKRAKKGQIIVVSQAKKREMIAAGDAEDYNAEIAEITVSEGKLKLSKPKRTKKEEEQKGE